MLVKRPARRNWATSGGTLLSSSCYNPLLAATERQWDGDPSRDSSLGISPSQ